MGEGRVEQAGAAGRGFQIGLARAFGGAILFALPLLMTMARRGSRCSSA